MKYQKLMKKIMEQLGEYKGIIDNLSICYLADKKKHEEELAKMEGVYTPQYIEEHKKNWKPARDYSVEINEARKRCQEKVRSYIEKIEKEMDGYFSVPVDSGFSATVTAVKSLGVTLNNREIELLQKSSGGYWGLRLLNELGMSRSKTEQGAVLEDGRPKRINKDVKTPYGAEKLPNIEKAYDSLQDMKNSVNMAFEAYCGNGYVLKDFIFPVNDMAVKTKENLEKGYGVQTKNPTLDALSISRMASAEKCFNEDYYSYTAFSEMMGGLASTMPEPKKKTYLTESDKKLIDALIDPDFPVLAKDRAVKIAKADSKLAEILALDSRYSTAVKDALGEVSEND